MAVQKAQAQADVPVNRHHSALPGWGRDGVEHLLGSVGWFFGGLFLIFFPAEHALRVPTDMASPRELAFLACFVVAHSHGGLTFPPPRNNHGNINPAIPDPPGGSGDKNHPGGSCAGGSCLWFQEGCYIGCPNCTLEMPQGGNRYNKPNCEHPLEPTLPEKYRTYNAKNLSPNGDWSRYHPWRAPGRAPVADPCGFAGGYMKAQGGGGETPVGAHQGDLGSKLPPLEGVKTEWVAGGVAEVGWMIAANHGKSGLL
jgi:hypothetical protein